MTDKEKEEFNKVLKKSQEDRTNAEIAEKKKVGYDKMTEEEKAAFLTEYNKYIRAIYDKCEKAGAEGKDKDDCKYKKELREK